MWCGALLPQGGKGGLGRHDHELLGCRREFQRENDSETLHFIVISSQ